MCIFEKAQSGESCKEEKCGGEEEASLEKSAR
jgi:hypothetical protein